MQPAHKLEAPPMPRETLLRLYREMVRLRTLDERMMPLQRQGRVGFYGACTGQEAATLASAIALEASDWIFPALREGGAMLLRGFPLVPYLCQIFGNAGDETKGRQMPSHMASRSVNQVRDRKSTRLNSSHSQISYAVFCLKKKKKHSIRDCT